MESQERFLLAEVAWKENRRGGVAGMTSVINVVMNRAAKHNATIESIVMAPKQFTSMSVKSDPEYGIDPTQADGPDGGAWDAAKSLAVEAACGKLEDITHGSTLYYAPAGLAKGTTKPYTLPDGSVVPFPASWNEAAVTYRATICGQYFFTE